MFTVRLNGKYRKCYHCEKTNLSGKREPTVTKTFAGIVCWMFETQYVAPRRYDGETDDDMFHQIQNDSPSFIRIWITRLIMIFFWVTAGDIPEA